MCFTEHESNYVNTTQSMKRTLNKAKLYDSSFHQFTVHCTGRRMLLKTMSGSGARMSDACLDDACPPTGACLLMFTCRCPPATCRSHRHTHQSVHNVHWWLLQKIMIMYHYFDKTLGHKFWDESWRNNEVTLKEPTFTK